MSDLHIELSKYWHFPSFEERPAYGVLVIAGDLIPRMERGVIWLRERIMDRPVIYVPGNHEFYSADVDRTVVKARQIADDTNIHVLNDQSVSIGGVQFIASTLWTDFALFGDPYIAMRAAHTSMNDFKRIRIGDYRRRLRPVDTLARHIRSRRFIEEELAKPFEGPRVVITHHAPYSGAIPPGQERDPVTPAYASDLSSVIERYRPDAWLYGHVHRSDRTLIGRTLLVANPKGYGPDAANTTHENPGFDPALTIEVGGDAGR